MSNLTKKQQLIIIIGGIILIFCFVYYTNKKGNYDYLEIENNNITKQEPHKEEIENIVLHITGEIQNEGVIVLKKGERIKDAIEAAGGTTEKANLSDINLAYELSDGQKLYIPSTNDEQEKAYIIEGTGQDEQIKKEELVNINTANQTELETITGIGPSTALKIINYRKENGKFNSIEEIKNVSGIGEAKFDTIKNEICIK